MEKEIKKILNELNIRISNKGYEYWVTAIEYVLQDPDISNLSITKELYPQLATIHNSTPSRIERALRHSIEEKGDAIRQYFNINYDITNRDFLYLCVDKVKKLREVPQGVVVPTNNRICNVCQNEEIKETDRFCKICGTKLKED